MEKMMDHIKLYTDGSSLGNPGPAGWGYVLEYKGFRKFGADSLKGPATNQLAELIAVFKGLKAISNPAIPVEVISDSEYVVKGASEWMADWKARDWRTAKGKKPANLGMWMRLDLILSQFNHVHFTWVKGHNGNQWNEYADELAHTAAELARERDTEASQKPQEAF
jgi:ribonuclease HI